MKSFISTLTHCIDFFGKPYSYIVQIAAIVLTTMLFTSCASFYKIESVKETTLDTIKALIERDKQFIIHLKDTSFFMANPSIYENGLKGTLQQLNKIQERYLHPRSKNKNVYQKDHEYEVLEKVHVYTTEKSVVDTREFMLPIGAITKIDINVNNVEATKRSKLIGKFVLGSATIGATTLLILAATSALEFSMNSGMGSFRWY